MLQSKKGSQLLAETERCSTQSLEISCLNGWRTNRSLTLPKKQKQNLFTNHILNFCGSIYSPIRIAASEPKRVCIALTSYVNLDQFIPIACTLQTSIIQTHHRVRDMVPWYLDYIICILFIIIAYHVN
jgi:hypothetical protein